MLVFLVVKYHKTFFLLHLLPEVDHILLSILNVCLWKGTKPIKGTWKMRACHKVPCDLCLVTSNPILGATEQRLLMSKRWLGSKSTIRSAAVLASGILAEFNLMIKNTSCNQWVALYKTGFLKHQQFCDMLLWDLSSTNKHIKAFDFLIKRMNISWFPTC